MDSDNSQYWNLIEVSNLETAHFSCSIHIVEPSSATECQENREPPSGSNWLVVYTYPSEKYEFVNGKDYPYLSWKLTNVWKHRPAKKLVLSLGFGGVWL